MFSIKIWLLLYWLLHFFSSGLAAKLWESDLLGPIYTSQDLKGETDWRFSNYKTALPICVPEHGNASLWEPLLPLLGKWMTFQGRCIREGLNRNGRRQLQDGCRSPAYISSCFNTSWNEVLQPFSHVPWSVYTSHSLVKGKGGGTLSVADSFWVPAPQMSDWFYMDFISVLHLITTMGLPTVVSKQAANREQKGGKHPKFHQEMRKKCLIPRTQNYFK